MKSAIVFAAIILFSGPSAGQDRDERFIGSELLLLCDRPNGFTCFTVRDQPAAIVQRQGSYSLIELRDGRSGWTDADKAQSLPVDRAHAPALDGPPPRNCEKLPGARVGMSAAQVLKSCWGKPRNVNSTVTELGKREQWIYPGGYIYLDNGVVTAIQTSQ